MGAFYRSMAVQYGMKWRILCSDNIRGDLLVLYPALAALSGLAIILAVRPAWTRG